MTSGEAEVDTDACFKHMVRERGYLVVWSETELGVGYVFAKTRCSDIYGGMLVIDLPQPFVVVSRTDYEDFMVQVRIWDNLYSRGAMDIPKQPYYYRAVTD